MSSHAQGQLLIGALTTMGQLAANRHLQQKELAVEQLRTGALAHMVDAFVTHRIDVVERGFATLLAHYAEQARHYMLQQKNFADRELDSNDPLRRIELRARIQDIDTLLASLRTDARLIYLHMTEIIRHLGGAAQDFGRDFAQPLALPVNMGGYNL